MNFLKQFFRDLFKKARSPVVQDSVIGTAQFKGKSYFFVRKNQEVFLVSHDTKPENKYSKKVTFSAAISRCVESMRDIDALEISQTDCAMVCTIKEQDIYKTVYLESSDDLHYRCKSIVKNPDGAASKLVLLENKKLALLTSVDGEICYRDIGTDNNVVQYHKTSIDPRDDSFDHAGLSIVGATNLDDGIFVVYESSYCFPGYQAHTFGAALLAHDNLRHVHWRAFYDEVPFWENFISRKDSDMNLKTLGSFFSTDDIKIFFYDIENQDTYFVKLHQPYARREVNNQKAYLTKHINNPIMRPNENHPWECHTALNPGALQIDSTTHLLYRAEGTAGLSVIGYGKSNNGLNFERFSKPVYIPRMDFEGVNISDYIKKTMTLGSFKSGYNHYSRDQYSQGKHHWHGVEDPRVTEMEGQNYMIYAAYNGYQMARPAITSISKEDFLCQKWNWKTPQLMTDVPARHGAGNKNVVLLPKKINNKYVLFHRVWPHIRIDYVDSLEFGPGIQYLKEVDLIPARGDSWDSHKVSISAPPILIDEGWLVIYQGAGSQDRRYKVGAMILDTDNPAKVLYRSNYPILTPGEWYENEYKTGVVYPCGAVLRDGMLNVYYGGSDKYVCLAQSPLQEFVDKLKQDPYEKSKLKKGKNIKELCI